ncbi:MAG: hypothetical protein ABI629_10675 [bacterium]
MSRSIVRQGLPSLVAAGLVLAIYTLSLWRMPLGVFWSPDEGGKFYQLASIDWDGHLAYSPPYVGRRIDPELRFYPGSTRFGSSFPYPSFEAQGQVHFHWPIWFPLLSRVFFEALGIAGIYVVPLLCGWLIGLASGWIAAGFDRRLAAPAILLVGLATPVWFYSLTFWEHTLAALLAMAAVGVALGPRGASAPALLAMLALLTAATLLRLEMIAFAASLLGAWGLAAWRTRPAAPPTPARRAPEAQPRSRTAASRRRWLALAVAAALLTVAVSMSLTERRGRQITGLPAKIGATLSHPSALPRAVAEVLVDRVVDEGPTMAPGWTAAATLAILACFVAPFVPRRIEGVLLLPALAFVLWYSIDLARLDQPYRSLHGVFAIAPFLALWIYAVPAARQWSPRQRIFADCAGIYLITGGVTLIVAHSNAGGRLVTGLEWGQRYLLTLYPMLAILALVAVQEFCRSPRTLGMKRVVAALAVAMIAVAVTLETRGIAMLRSNHEGSAALQRALQTEEPLLTDIWWLPTALAPMFVSLDAYRVQGRADVADWITLGRANGATAFTFVSQAPVNERDFASEGLRRIPERSRDFGGLYITRFALNGASEKVEPALSQ